MGRKAINFTDKQNEFISNYLKNSKHGSKLKLPEEFERRFGLKYSYKTLSKFLEKKTAVKKTISKVRKKENNKRYYKQNALKIKQKSSFNYKKNYRSILAKKKKIYQNLETLRRKLIERSKLYYVKNRQKQRELAKNLFLKRKTFLLLKSRIKNSIFLSI